MMISLTAPFLLFPTRRDAPPCKLHFLLSGRKVQEADVRLCAPDDADFVGCMDASAWFRQTLEVFSSDADDALLSSISVSDEPPVYAPDNRPLLHFTPPVRLAQRPERSDSRRRGIPPVLPVESIRAELGEYALGARRQPRFVALDAPSRRCRAR